MWVLVLLDSSRGYESSGGFAVPSVMGAAAVSEGKIGEDFRVSSS